MVLASSIARLYKLIYELSSYLHLIYVFVGVNVNSNHYAFFYANSFYSVQSYMNMKHYLV
jgi:hypothetical protein